jgi:hypothetical protein
LRTAVTTSAWKREARLDAQRGDGFQQVLRERGGLGGAAEDGASTERTNSRSPLIPAAV